MGQLVSIPWLLALFSAVVFAVIAFRAGRMWPVWALGWAIYALILSTWVAGIFVAAYLPVLETESALQFRIVLVGGLLIVIPAALLAWRLKPEPVTPPQDNPARKQ